MEILYKNLPGVYLEKVDGKLLISPDTRNHVIAVFGTTDSGPAYFPTIVTDNARLSQLFGSYGTGIQGVFEVMQGNPESIALTRIGGSQTEIFLNAIAVTPGEENPLVKIKTRDFGPQVMEYYGLYISPVNKEFKIFDLTKKNQNGTYVLVYSNLESDYDKIASKTDVEVLYDFETWDEFFLSFASSHTGDFGSETDPISFKEIYESYNESDPFFTVIPGIKGSDDTNITNMKLMEWMLKGFFAASSFSFDQVFVPGAYIDANNVADDEKERIYELSESTASGTTTTWSQDDTLTVEIGSNSWTYAAPNNSTTTGDMFVGLAALISESEFFEANANSDASTYRLDISGKPGYDFETPVVTAKDSGGNNMSTNISVTSIQSPYDNKYLSYVENVTLAPVVPTVSGSTPTSMVWSFTDPYFINGTEVLEWNSGTGIASSDYEVVVNGDKIYVVLKDSPSALGAATDDYIKVSYVKTRYDALPYFHWKEIEGELHVEWSPVKTFENKYHEANFGYEIARFCHEVSTNSKECLGVIGVKPPKSLAARDIARWIGTLPKTDEWGNIVANGTGLLGYKYIAGSVDVAPGFYYTDSRYMDGVPVQDRDGSPIDIGKYLSVVVGWGILQNAYKGKPFNYFASCEGVFAAVDEMLPPQIAMTNKEIPLCVIPYRLSLEQLNDLTGLGYTVVSFDIDRNAAVVVDSPTVANPNSDYQRRQTVKIFKYLNQKLRNVMKPFIGRPINTTVIESQKKLIQDIFDDAMKMGMIQKYNFQIKATPRMQILNYEEIHYTIIPAFELKQVYGYAAMQIPTSTLQAAANK